MLVIPPNGAISQTIIVCSWSFQAWTDWTGLASIIGISGIDPLYTCLYVIRARHRNTKSDVLIIPWLLRRTQFHGDVIFRVDLLSGAQSIFWIETNKRSSLLFSRRIQRPPGNRNQQRNQHDQAGHCRIDLKLTLLLTLH